MTLAPMLLYHYTNAHGLYGILTEKKIRASSYRFMNDAQELEHAFSLITEAYPPIEHKGLSPPPVEKLLSEFAETIRRKKWDYDYDCLFVSSFSQYGDQLSQWRGYAGPHSGYSLGFRTDGLGALKKETRLEKCEYDKDRQIEIIKNVLSGHLPGIMEAFKLSAPGSSQNEKAKSIEVFFDRIDQAVADMIDSASRLKHYSFKEEQEWRLIVGPLEPEDERILYHPYERVLIPYVEIEFYPDELPIEHIFVGPRPHQQRTAGSLRQMLNKWGYHQVEIDLSHTPFRNWQ
ncbi:MAG: DUF2971 domain-containing protein [Deltaproteobacteria bacterium]|nr:DUF2971 domain-containing protein [Deltaproteobacteria bacterium]